MAASSSKNLLKTIDEVLFISTQGREDQNWNVGMWDARTGNLLQTYRGGSAAAGSLCLLGGESIMAASTTKPVIHVWSMLRQGQKHRKLICGGKISCLAVSPDIYYLAAGIVDKIHIWQICTGELFSVLSFNSVEVTCLKFSQCGQYLVSGYRDGTVAVWELQEVLNFDPMRLTSFSPVNKFTGHAGEVTDIFTTYHQRVASSSRDFTVRIWNLLSSEELKMFELGAPVTCVVVDHMETALYAGDILGNVYCIDMHYQAAERSVHIDTRGKVVGFTQIKAHLAAVTRLGLTLDRSKLVSASDDKTVKVWSMMSPLATITITLNEKVTNLLVVATPRAVVDPDESSTVYIANLKRNLHGLTGEDDCDCIIFHTSACLKELPKPWGSLEAVEGLTNKIKVAGGAAAASASKEVESLKQKAVRLKKANEEMYNFALKEIVK